jgi:hypothetical protein
MRVLKSDYICPGLNRQHFVHDHSTVDTYFLTGISANKSLFPLTLSARYTLPVIATATMWECSLNGLNEIGSCISFVASFRE